jgi:phospholipid/cholesterol/gamma-HCH transport system substrate-binding protein
MPEVRHLELKAALMLLLLVLLVGGSALFLMYARGAFEPTQQLTLVADDAEGAAVGMDLTFSGFPIGRVQRIELTGEGNVHVVVDVAQKDAKWLRTTSVFTLERSLVGAARLRAYTGVLADPPLPDGAVRPVLLGDAAAEIPRLMGSIKQLVENLSSLTADDSALSGSLANLNTITGKFNGPQGVLGAITGEQLSGKQIAATLERTNALLARLDGLAANADKQVFGEGGVMGDAQATVQRLNALLGDAQQSLKKVDAVLAEAQAVGANARVATEDLGTLRAEVESSLRKVQQLVNEVNRKWPFKRDMEIRLP